MKVIGSLRGIGNSFADYVMQRRLDGVAADLRDPAHRSRVIGDIAFNWGFADLSHFARRFKQRFGIRASEWRHAQALAGAVRPLSFGG